MTYLEELKALYEEKLYSYKNARNKYRKLELRKEMILMWDNIVKLETKGKKDVYQGK